MIPSTSQQNKANNFFLQLRRFDPEHLMEYGIATCDQCGGKGLGNITGLDENNYAWDGISYCDKCKGIGFDGLENLKTFDGKLYICGVCNGVGCDDCYYTGFTDWISHAMGR